MSAVAVRETRRWATAGAAAALATVALVILFSLTALPPLPSASAPSRVRTPVELATRTDARLVEETMMRDLAPLFLPTERNARLKLPVAREPGDAFLDVQPPKFEFSDTLRIGLPAAVTLKGKSLTEAGPFDVLDESPMLPLAGFGRAGKPESPPQTRGAFVEVVATSTAELIIAQTLATDARPSTAQPWRSLQFIAAVDPSGLVSPLLLTGGSGVDEVDNHFRKYLTEFFCIGDRLPPGIYRVTVGP